MHRLPAPPGPDSWLSAATQADADDLALSLDWALDIAERDVELCAPTGWSDGVRRTALAARVPAARLDVENVAMPAPPHARYAPTSATTPRLPETRLCARQ